MRVRERMVRMGVGMGGCEGSAVGVALEGGC